MGEYLYSHLSELSWKVNELMYVTADFRQWNAILVQVILNFEYQARFHSVMVSTLDSEYQAKQSAVMLITVERNSIDQGVFPDNSYDDFTMQSNVTIFLCIYSLGKEYRIKSPVKFLWFP